MTWEYLSYVPLGRQKSSFFFFFAVFRVPWRVGNLEQIHVSEVESGRVCGRIYVCFTL